MIDGCKKVFTLFKKCALCLCIEFDTHIQVLGTAFFVIKNCQIGYQAKLVESSTCHIYSCTILLYRQQIFENLIICRTQIMIINALDKFLKLRAHGYSKLIQSNFTQGAAQFTEIKFRKG